MDERPGIPAPATIGGYRIVRTLGAGPRATVRLGHAEGHPPAAVKTFAAAVPADDIEREAEALMRAAGDHVVRLDDLALDEHGRPAFLLERVAGPSLGALLDRRGAIRPGEAVTILAPLAATIARMHAGGVVHGALEPACVLFSDAGSPTVVGFGDARLLDLAATGRARVAERTQLLARDREALRRLVLTVLERTALATAGEVAARRALTELPEGVDYAERLADAVFELAEPEPVDLDPAAVAGSVPARLTGAPVGAPTRVPAGSRGSGAAPRLLVDGLQVPEWLRTALGGRAATAPARLRAAAASVRRPFWIAGGAAAVALTAALVLVPADGPPGDGPASGIATEPAAADPAQPAPEERRAAQPAVLDGDDPAAATRELLDARAECFRDLSVLCLDAVDQADSSASAADTASILAAQEGGGIAADGVVIDGTAETVERMGDTALVRITAPDAEPASVLVIRTEAGWRIRGFPGAADAAAVAD
jgi:hypothetical protein